MTVYTSLPITAIITEYKAGEGMRSLATRYLVSYGTIRNILAASRVPLRRQGRQSPAGLEDTHYVESTYVSNEFWSESRTNSLHSAEIIRLRNAIGWDFGWADEDKG